MPNGHRGSAGPRLQGLDGIGGKLSNPWKILELSLAQAAHERHNSMESPVRVQESSDGEQQESGG